MIPSYAFGGCSNVKIVVFGSNNGESELVEISPNAFNGAGNGSVGAPITEIVINSSVTKIGR